MKLRFLVVVENSQILSLRKNITDAVLKKFAIFTNSLCNI